jgi:hypothetical protein
VCQGLDGLRGGAAARRVRCQWPDRLHEGGKELTIPMSVDVTSVTTHRLLEDKFSVSFSVLSPRHCSEFQFSFQNFFLSSGNLPVNELLQCF